MAKVDLYPHFRELLESLNSANVKYLVLGGYAVIYYGYHRVTQDIDVWIEVDPLNAQKVSRVLRKWGGFRSRDVPKRLFLDRGRIIMLGNEPQRVDLLTQPSGVDFETCYARRTEVIWDGVTIPLIAFEDLVANKRASGREKDLADLVYLEGKPVVPKAAPRRTKRKKR